MRPRPLHSKTDLIAAVMDHVPTRACQRALRYGKVDALGGFTSPRGLDRLVLRITSNHGKVWLIGLDIDNDVYEFRVVWMDKIDWSVWAGNGRGKDPIFDGDDPMLMSTLQRNNHVETTE